MWQFEFILDFHFIIKFIVRRLYTEADGAKLLEHTPPEMQRTDLCSTILYLKALGIDNILT